MRGTVIYRSLSLLAAAGLLCPARSSAADATRGWSVAGSSHFEVYSDAGAPHANATLREFEQLRSFFASNDLIRTAASDSKTPVRIIQFASKTEYQSFAVRPTADAYFTGAADRDYIVMPLSGTADLGIAAHEYAHFLLHSAGLKLPAWLSEGLAEVFSTVTIKNNRCDLGGVIPAHMDTLRHTAWLTPSELFTAGLNSQMRSTRAGAALFYAESWAVTSILTSSPKYLPLFAQLIAKLNTGKVDSAQAIEDVYRESSDALLQATHAWMVRPKLGGRRLASAAFSPVTVSSAEVSRAQMQLVLADLLAANGKWHRSKEMYLRLLGDSPDTSPNKAEILASLGAVSLQEGDARGAVSYLGKALANGVTDAALCYRYAVLADQLDAPSEQIEQALEQAVRLKPDFDDAHFQLALLKSNASDFGGAVTQFQAMRKPAPQRAFAYWIALAYALCQSGNRDEAQSAAKQAIAAAGSPEERARAAQIGYEAGTDLAVRFARGPNGNVQLVTTRVPHGSTDFNPFVEAGDDLQVATGKLVAAECTAGKLSGFVVQNQAGRLTLSLPDPTHVLIRNGPQDFYCGAQDGRNVKVEYAAAAKAQTGILRGMDFR